MEITNLSPSCNPDNITPPHPDRFTNTTQASQPFFIFTLLMTHSGRESEILDNRLLNQTQKIILVFHITDMILYLDQM